MDHAPARHLYNYPHVISRTEDPRGLGGAGGFHTSMSLSGDDLESLLGEQVLCSACNEQDILLHLADVREGER